jgi:hypothetical protein
MRAENANSCSSAYLPADYMLSDNIEITLSLNRARDFLICRPNEVDDRPAVGRQFLGARIAGKKTEPEHRPITYWLDYVRSVAGPDNPLISGERSPLR